MTLCTMLLMCAALPVCAFADDVHIFTAYQPFMYFEKYDGVWGDLGTPPHSVVETGQPAYCLQMSMESPYGDGYDVTDGSQYYTPTILNGLKAILAHGYPASTGGFTDNEAQTAGNTFVFSRAGTKHQLNSARENRQGFKSPHPMV